MTNITKHDPRTNNVTINKVRELIIRSAFYSNNTDLSIVQIMIQDFPYAIMQIDPNDSSKGYWVLNIFGCALGEKESNIMFPEDTVPEDWLNGVDSMPVDEEGTRYLWKKGSEPSLSPRRFEGYRGQLIELFTMEDMGLNQGRGLPYRACIAGG